MGNSLYLDRIERPRLEFGILRLNFTNLTYINNGNFSVNKTTESFTGHGLVVWKGSFFTLLEDVFQSAEDNLDSLAHPLFHYATIIEENEDRVFMTPPEKTKLAGLAAGANNYVHPTTHSLSMITETTDRKSFTPTERTKLNGIEQGANKYIHPDSHQAAEIDGLLDIDGFLTPDTPSYLYSNRRHFLSKELSFSFGETEYIIDDCKGVDAVNYLGTGVVGTTVPFRLGFNQGIYGLLMFFSTTSSSLVLRNSMNKNISMFKDYSSAYISSGTLACDKSISIGANDITLNISNQYLNRLDTTVPVFGMKFSYATAQQTQVPNYNPVTNKYSILTQSSFVERQYDYNLCYRLFFNINHTLHYISKVIPTNPYDSRYEWRKAADGGLIQTIPLYHYSHYLYCSDKTPDGYYSVFHVQYDAGTAGVSFRIFYNIYHQTVWNLNFQFAPLKTTSTIYKHSNNEVVTDISIAPIINHDNFIAKTQNVRAVADYYFLAITSNNGTNSWITIYRMRVSTKELVLHQTLSFSYIVNAVAFDCVRASKVSSETEFYYQNTLAFYANKNLYVYSKKIDIINANFFLLKTVGMGAPAGLANTDIKSAIFYSKLDYYYKDPGVLTRYENNGFIILHTNQYIIIVHLYMSPSYDHPSNPVGAYFYMKNPEAYYTDKYRESVSHYYNVIPINSDRMEVLDCMFDFNVTPYMEYEKPLALITDKNKGAQVTLFYPLSNRIYQNINLGENYSQSIKQTTVALDCSYSDRLPKLYVGQGTNFITYEHRLMNIFSNPTMKTAMWEYRVDVNDPLLTYRHNMGSKPIIIFCYVFESASTNALRKLVAIYNGKQYFLDSNDYPPTSDQDGYYDRIQPLRINTDHTDTELTYVIADSDVINEGQQGAHYQYYGFFGDKYNVSKNGTSSVAKGKPDLTCFIEMSPGDVVDVGFKPNIVKILPLNRPPIVATGWSMLMVMLNDNYEKLYIFTPEVAGSNTLDNTLVTVSGNNITLNASSLGNCLIMAIGADLHSQSSDFVIQASPINPLFMSMIDAPTNLGEKDNVTIKTESIIPITPTDLSPVDKRYLALNTFGDIAYNNTDGVYPGEWNKPDEVLYFDTDCTKLRNTGPYRYLPVAKVNFIDDTITEVVSYPQSDFYIVNWFDFMVGTPVVLDNKYMSLGIMVKVFLKNDSGEIFNNDTLTNNGVKVSFDHEFITVKTSTGQTYVLDNDNSCKMKLIIKRMF